MATNQEGVHAAVRALTGTARSYNEDWHALFTQDVISSGTFNERLLNWINDQLGTSYSNVNSAMNAFAVDQGFTSWSDMNTFSTSLAAALLAEWADSNGGLALDFTDLTAKVIDPVTGANNFAGSVNSLLSITTSPKWILNSSGVYVQTSANTLGTDHNTAGERLGALIEEARTPLAAKSRRLDDASYWTATNVTTSAVQGVDGVSGSATRITSTAGNATIIGTANTSASAARRFSPFIRRVSGTGNLEYTLDNGGTWTAFTAPTSSFARFDVGATVTNPRVGFRIVSSGDSFDIDFANGETGTFSTSPIESGTSPTARAADNVSLATSLFPFNASAYTLYANTTAATTNPTVGAYALTLDDGTASELSFVGRAQAAAVVSQTVIDGGFGQVASTTTNTMTGGAVAKMAGAFSVNDFAVSLNGGSVAIDTSGTMPSPNKLIVGNRTDLLRAYNGHISQLMYLPRRMSNADLQALTT